MVYPVAEITVQVEQFMIAWGGDTLSAKEILERLGLKHRPSLSNNYLRPALALRWIERTIPDKPNSSKQKYRAVRNDDDR